MTMVIGGGGAAVATKGCAHCCCMVGVVEKVIIFRGAGLVWTSYFLVHHKVTVISG